MSDEIKFPDVHTLDVTASHGVPFRVLLITGPDGAPERLRFDDQPTVEFYDRRYARKDGAHAAFTEHGQFVSSYYADTVMEHESGAGLTLYGGVEAWQVDGRTMEFIRKWVALYLLRHGAR